MRYTYSSIRNQELGMATPLLLAVLLLFAVVAGAYFYSGKSDEPILREDGTIMNEGDVMMDSGDHMTDATPTPGSSSKTVTTATGTVGEYTKAEYDAAVSSGKVVVLYYFANWCPICRVEFPKFRSAVEQLSDSRFVALRVNFNDSETTPEEEASARAQQVGYQHTVVIVRNGEQVYKSQSVDDYQATITEYLP